MIYWTIFEKSQNQFRPSSLKINVSGVFHQFLQNASLVLPILSYTDMFYYFCEYIMHEKIYSPYVRPFVSKLGVFLVFKGWHWEYKFVFLSMSVEEWLQSQILIISSQGQLSKTFEIS